MHYIVGTITDKDVTKVRLQRVDDDGNETEHFIDEQLTEVTGYLGVDRKNRLVLAKSIEELPAVIVEDSKPVKQKK